RGARHLRARRQDHVAKSLVLRSYVTENPHGDVGRPPAGHLTLAAPPESKSMETRTRLRSFAVGQASARPAGAQRIPRVATFHCAVRPAATGIVPSGASA